ncbi:MAG: hypothetical protein KKE20_06450 [Nanoarchaeota archaeon]|nr:hypothetical protein [Nanoarchaeota archaeon]
MEINEISGYPPEAWLVEHLDACPFFIEAAAYGFTTPFDKFQDNYGFTISFFRDNQIDWATLIEDQNRMGEKISSIGLKDPDFFPTFFKEWDKGLKEFYEYVLQLRKKGLSNLDDQEFIDLFRQYYDNAKKAHFPGWIDAFIFFADKHFSDLIKDFCNKKNLDNPQRMSAALSAPVEPSFIFESEEELYRISMIKDEEERDSAIKRYLDRFFWLKGSYAGSSDYTKNDVIERIKSMKKPEPAHITHRKEKDILMQTHGFTEDIKSMVKLIETISKWQDNRKIFTLTRVYLEEEFLKEAGNKTGISRDLLRYSSIDDFLRLLEGRVDKKEFERMLIEINRGSLWIYSHGKAQKMVTGKEAEDIFEKIQGKQENDVEELEGFAASFGKAKGKAAIIKKIDDNQKVQQGDIIVTSMTRPEHTPAMMKAAAIVTDDGGITCHAAIVSRELGIPCIIGTKKATKAFKDGDMIEVDADKGIVRRIG